MRKIITILLKMSLILLVIFWIHNNIEKKTEPQPEMEEKTREQAQKYIDTVFKDGTFIIYDMEFYPNSPDSFFNYAAMVRNEENNIEFRIYHNNKTGKMDDDYAEMKWKDDLTDDILPFIREHFDKNTNVYVGYEDFNDANIDPDNPGEYKDYDGKPYIQVSVQHPRRAEDEKLNNEFIHFLKKECGLKHARVGVAYYKNQEPLMGEEWYVEF